jgi:hypothetical protein
MYIVIRKGSAPFDRFSAEQGSGDWPRRKVCSHPAGEVEALRFGQGLHVLKDLPRSPLSRRDDIFPRPWPSVPC